MPWAAAMLDSIGDVTPFVALLPHSGNDRRDAARLRLYTTRLRFRDVGTATAGGQRVSILLRD